MNEEKLSIEELALRAQALIKPGARAILGITGVPGAGKSTVARELASRLGPEICAIAPMDGFHLSNKTLIAWERRERKGAWDTFDADGYINLLQRLRSRDDEFVHAPDYYREFEESIGSALPIHRDTPLIISEGNYLLSDQGSWSDVSKLLTECWFITVDQDTRIQRLIKRHIEAGKSEEDAKKWSLGSDQKNAEIIDSFKNRADLIVEILEG